MTIYKHHININFLNQARPDAPDFASSPAVYAEVLAFLETEIGRVQTTDTDFTAGSGWRILNSAMPFGLKVDLDDDRVADALSTKYVSLEPNTIRILKMDKDLIPEIIRFLEQEVGKQFAHDGDGTTYGEGWQIKDWSSYSVEVRCHNLEATTMLRLRYECDE